VLCLISAFTNPQADGDRSPPLTKGDLGGFYSGDDVKSPLPPFFKGGIQKNPIAK
jgi:hypothetical protein